MSPRARHHDVEHSRPLPSNTLLAAFVTDTDKHECFASNTTASKDAEMLNPSTMVSKEDTAFVVLNITQQLNIKMRPGTVAKSSTDTEAVQEYLALVAQHNGAWLKNMTTVFDSIDFLESITAVVVGSWGARDVARVLTELPHSDNCLAGVQCAVDSAWVLAPNSLPGSSTRIMPSLCALCLCFLWCLSPLATRGTLICLQRSTSSNKHFTNQSHKRITWLLQTKLCMAANECLKQHPSSLFGASSICCITLNSVMESVFASSPNINTNSKVSLQTSVHWITLLNTSVGVLTN